MIRRSGNLVICTKYLLTTQVNSLHYGYKSKGKRALYEHVYMPLSDSVIKGQQQQRQNQHFLFKLRSL